MDSKTTELRARLRARYEYFREAIGHPEPESGYFRWTRSRLREETVEAAKEQTGAIVGDSMAGSGGKADQMALVILRAIAWDEKLGFLCKCLGIRLALDCIPGDEYWPKDQWVIARPNGTTFPHDFRQARTTLALVAPLLDEWIDHLADDAPALDGLTPDARVVLAAMRDLGAFLPDARITQEMIRDKAAKLGEEIVGTRFGQAINLLKAGGYVESKSGTATWLTARGQKTADMVKPPSKSK